MNPDRPDLDPERLRRVKEGLKEINRRGNLAVEDLKRSSPQLRCTGTYLLSHWNGRVRCLLPAGHRGPCRSPFER